MVILHLGDCFDVLRTMPDACVDSVVTDPPAGIAFMGKEWDDFRRARNEADVGRDSIGGRMSAHAPEIGRRSRAAFIAWLTEIMRECLRCLKPGGHALIWALPRTAHWTATAVEDAGFEIRDVVAHMFGTGFPKSYNLRGEHVGKGTALKPGREDWILARKPLDGTVAENVLRFGTGALNVDGCRVESPGGIASAGGMLGASTPLGGWSPTNAGRWPANVVLDVDAALALNEQSGWSRSTVAVRHRSGGKTCHTGAAKPPLPDLGYCDTGGASRFFYVAKSSRAEREAGVATNGDRGNRHPTVKAIALMRWLCRLITPPDGVVLDPFVGSGSTGCAAVLEGFRFVGIEREPEYVAMARARIAHWASRADDAQITLDEAAR